MHHLGGVNLESDMQDHGVHRRTDDTWHQPPRDVVLVYTREVQKLGQWPRETLFGTPGPQGQQLHICD